jgi:hypothetical protein
MPWGTILGFIWELFTGEVWNAWQAHKAKEQAQAVSNSPTTKEELDEVLEHHDL